MLVLDVKIFVWGSLSGCRKPCCYLNTQCPRDVRGCPRNLWLQYKVIQANVRGMSAAFWFVHRNSEVFVSRTLRPKPLFSVSFCPFGIYSCPKPRLLRRKLTHTLATRVRCVLAQTVWVGPTAVASCAWRVSQQTDSFAGTWGACHQ